VVDVWFGCVWDGRGCGCGCGGRWGDADVGTGDGCGYDSVRSGIGIVNGYLSETMMDEGLAVFEVGVRHRLHLRL